MKLLFDLLPIALFFIGFHSGLTVPALHLNKPIEFATALAIVVTVGQIAYLKLRGRKIELMQWMALISIGVLGGATIALHDQVFIYWKPTVLYWIGAVAFVISRYVYGKHPLKAVMGKELSLPEPVWDRLLWIWAAFFVLMGVVNLAVAFSLPEATWVNFKLICVIVITPVFILLQALYLSRHLPADDKAEQSGQHKES
ncbi:septation protein A [Chitinimonas lacunae]|uniref:Inner membrane-spanning protein YciB n=1 Tax=Chitinimonas lacunae TaxID=1963018 RepID=A0ABV8MKD8_9NEIS